MGSVFRRPKKVPSPKFPKSTRKSLIETSKERDIRLDYVFHRVLGEGHFGKVRRALRKEDQLKVAVKSVLKKKIAKPEHLRQEVNALTALDHPNIVKLYDIYEDLTHVHLVMELCSGGELFGRIVKHGHLTEAIAADLMHQILSAISHFHSKNIVHRDLKPENMLFVHENSWTLKICDFGLSRFYEKTDEMHSRLGTAFYLSPEVLAKKYTSKCDIWSAGVILYIMLCGYPPFFGNSDALIFKSIKNDPVVFTGEAWEKVSQEAKDFVLSLLNRDEHERPTAAEALEDKAWRNVGTTEITAKALDSLAHFSAMNKFKRAALNYMAKTLKSDEISQLEQEFRTMDTDLDGFISSVELADAMKRTHSLGEVNTLLRELDANGDSRIEWREYVQAAVARKDFLREERIAETFRYFDEDKSGKISLGELEGILGGSADAKMMTEMLKAADLNQDGEIDLQEFKTMLLKSVLPESTLQIAVV